MTAAIESQTASRRYGRADSAVFFKTRERYGELSNMAGGFPIRVGGVTAPSSEALYQACRFPHLPDVQKLILSQKSPMTAKMVSKPYRSQSRDDWDDVRVAIMKWCLRVKLIQHWDSFGRVLLGTADRPIVEQSSKDPFWGAIPDRSNEVLVGQNVLGRLLMELRALAQRGPSSVSEVKPVPINHFCMLGKPIPAIRLTRRDDDFDLPLLRESPARKAPAVRDVIQPSLAKAASQKRKGVKKESAQLPMFGLEPEKLAGAKIEQRNYHVLPSRKGGWDVLRDGNKRASFHFATKREALEKGRALAKNHKVDLVQHSKDSAQDRSEVLAHPTLPFI